MGKKYIKCPRCELNYILEGEDYCNVCKNEMKHHAENDDDELLDFEDMEFCPVCGQNYIKEDETMCYECRGKGGDDNSDDKHWKDDERLSPDNDVDDDDEDDDYNPGFGEVDENGNEIDPFKESGSLLDDDVPIDFVDEEELEELDEEIAPIDDFEVVDVADDEEDDEDDEDDDYDFEDGDMLGKKK